MKKSINVAKLLFIFVVFLSCSNIKIDNKKSNVIIIQPIITQSDIGNEPAKINLSEKLIEKAYSKADIDFLFLEPFYYNNSKARDGEINLDSIVNLAKKDKILRGQNDIINMFFVNAIDGKPGPTGRGMINGNIVFIALGDNNKIKYEDNKTMEAFIIAHEVGHNLGLKHVVDDTNIVDSLPNIQGDGAFKDRIDPKNSLTDYQIKEIKKSPLVHFRISFLKKEKASIAILDESFEPYFSKLQRKEISTFVQEKAPINIDSARVFARKKFSSAVMEFSTKEKRILSFVVKKTNRWLSENEINLMANQPWRFIKIQNWLCGGFAHTRGTYIILSQAYLDRLTKDWSENMDKESELKLVKSLGGLLVHEQMHSLQRTFKSKFEKLYSENWNFKKQQINDEKEIIKNQVSNPDAPIAEWLIPDPKIQDKFYWVRTLITKNIEIPVMGRDFVDVAFEIFKDKEGYSVLRLNNVLLSRPLTELTFYTNSYPVKRGLDHPNEISAYMFSDFFKANYDSKLTVLEKEIQPNNNYDLFLNWVKSEMK
tara:strand:+ start:1331 stop:2947 length:1617 start_codon:yes stop_codon:yes gene_type:complete